MNDYSTGELIQLEEATRWNIAGLDTGEDHLEPWVVPDDYRTFLSWQLGAIQTELARRERLRHHPIAPPWPDTTELDAIKAKVDLVRFIEEHAPVSFQRHGKEHVCCCPFPEHEDNSPSFSVNQERGVFHCFGCKRSGNVFQFAQEWFHCLSFPDAVDLVAGYVGIERRARHKASGSSVRRRPSGFGPARTGTVRVG